MRHFLNILGLLICLVSPLTWGASRLGDLYQAEVPVLGNEGIDSPVVGDALLKVLVKATGMTNFDEYPDVAVALADPKNFVREFGYHTVDVATTLEEKQRLGRNFRPQRVMRVAFLRGAVLQLIRRAGLPLWSPNRPSVMLWLAIDDYDSRYWVAPSTQENLSDQVNNLAIARGLPLQFPYVDMEDDFALQPQELLARDYSRVGVASARYRADVVLAGQAVQTSAGQWIGNWRYVLDGEVYSYEVLDASPEDFLTLGIDALANHLAAKYAVVSNASHEVLTMQINGLNNFRAYEDVNTYLNSLTAINQANIDIIDGDLVVFTLQLTGTLEQLDNALALDKKLLPIQDAALTQSYDLQYRWNEASR